MKKFFSTILLLSLTLPSFANYGVGGGFAPGLGLGGGGMGFGMSGSFQLYDDNGNIINSEANINTIAMNISMAASEMIVGGLSNGAPTPPEKVDPAKMVEQTIKQYGLNKTENAYLREEVFNRAVMLAASSSGYRTIVLNDPNDMNSGYKEGYHSSDKVNPILKAIESSGFNPPSNSSEALEIQNIFSKEMGPEEFIKQASSKLTGESKTYVLKQGMMRYPINDENRTLFTKELLKGDIDQDTLLMLFQQELLNYDMMTGKMTEPDPQMMDLILSKFDIDHKDQIFGQSFLCTQLSSSYMMTNQAKDQMAQAIYDSGLFDDSEYCIECENQGGFQQFESQDAESSTAFQYDESLWEAQKKEMLLQQQQIVEKLIEYGADPTQECADGKMPLDYLEVLVQEELYEGDNDSVQEVAYGNTPKVPCIESVGSDNYATLCQTSDIIATLSNQLLSNDRSAKKRDSLDTTYIYNEGRDKCNFAMFDRVVKRNGQGMTREITFEVTPNGARDSFVLKGRDKELFIKELERISGVKY